MTTLKKYGLDSSFDFPSSIKKKKHMKDNIGPSKSLNVFKTKINNLESKEREFLICLMVCH